MSDGTRHEVDAWIGFLLRLLAHFLALALWLFMAWALNEHIVQRFPVHDTISKLCIRIAEILLDIAILWQLLKILFQNKRNKRTRWWI
jgi:hypothetical protein